MRVTLTAEYAGKASAGYGHYVKGGPKAGTYLIPENAEVKVTAPPLPKEPPMGSLVVPKTDFIDAPVYRRSGDGWRDISLRAGRGITWEHLNTAWGRGQLVRLVPETELF